jgi:tRNA 5-methylaminomethyl-2-thiouridine biosynthesis bifunctional protein
MTPLPQARLRWDGNQPRALDYDDVYFSARDPRGEVHTVFIEANRLSRRFLTARRFAIGETGFGTGLNFCLTLETWREHALPDAFLSYLSVEAHPMAPADLARSLRAQGIAEDDIAALLSQYPPPLSGMHRIHLPADRVVLTLVYGDAAPALARVRGAVDAWFLDGFAPSRNPALWNLAVFRQLARLSRAGTTLGTFTAAGQVRRDLAEVGFTVHKAPGFSGKRERLTGVFRGGSPPVAAPERIAVVGAGLAGLSTAVALHERGLGVTVFDPHGPGGHASGNPAALLTPHLSAGDALHNALTLNGIRATHALLHAACNGHGQDIVLAEGVEHRGITRHAARRLARLAASDPALTGGLFSVRVAGVEAPVLFYPDGLGIDLGGLCRRLAAGVDLRRRHVVSIDPGAERVALETREGVDAFDAVVIATGSSEAPLIPGQPRPSIVGGQMTRIRTPLPALGRVALSGRGYCLPEQDGQHWLGATYRRDTAFPGVRDEDNEQNLAQLRWVDPALEERSKVTVSGAWYGARAVFPDRMPMIGPMTIVADETARTFECVFGNIGYGSRGLLYAPLGAQMLADRICGLPEPMQDILGELFSPSRFQRPDTGP